MILSIGLGTAMALNCANLEFESFDKAPSAIIRKNNDLDPMVKFNSLFNFEINSNSAFVAHDQVLSYFDNWDGDYMLCKVRCKKDISAELISISRKDNIEGILDYEEVYNNEVVKIQPRKKVNVKSKMMYAKRV